MGLETPATVEMIKNVINGVTPPKVAEKASKDGNGKVIADTYVLKNTANGGFEAVTGSATGEESIAIGANSLASGYRSIAVGRGCEAINENAIAIGSTARARNVTAIAIGNAADAKSAYAISAGANSEASDPFSIAIGAGATTISEKSIAIGANSHSDGSGIAIGQGAKALGGGSVQIGAGTNGNPNSLQFLDKQIIAYDEINTELLLSMFPVGAYYITESTTSPASLFGGKWVQVKDRFILGATSNSQLGREGGVASVTLTVAQIPPHGHKPHEWALITSAGANTGNLQITRTNSGKELGNEFIQDSEQNRYTSQEGGGQSHTNIPPYRMANIWRREA